MEKLAGDVLRVRIAIADVHARVPEGTAVDGHALTNTTSVYAGVAVFPMLPERLSNDLTSLNPNEDRLAVVVDLDVSADGRVHREAVTRALVVNHAKLDYEAVGAWLEGNGAPPTEIDERPDLEEQIRLQDEAEAAGEDVGVRFGGGGRIGGGEVGHGRHHSWGPSAASAWRRWRRRSARAWRRRSSSVSRRSGGTAAGLPFSLSRAT